MGEDFVERLKSGRVQAVILLGTLALALISNMLFGAPESALNFLTLLFGGLVAFEIVYFVTLEVKEGAKNHGWKHEALDTVVALLVALGIWFGASFLLNTSSPLSAVVSCSMLPNLQRGDFVLVQGAPVRAYDISMTQAEMESLNGRAEIGYPGGNASIDGSLFPYCVANSYSEMCRAFIDSPDAFVEKKGAFTYTYERCDLILRNGTLAHMPCLKAVSFKGTDYLANFSNDIIVYQPPAGDYYARIGDIVHRAMFRIDVDGKYYYITRGDNNPILDSQSYEFGTGMMNRPIPHQNLRGKVISRIPILGYFKLFIQGYFQEDSQCRTQLEFTHA
ncbi:hypothetical protein L0Y65_03635 [Candidatus Micrarchaeota archaeon]|nr:hypothetical protein [Candidatus Micrarchaeota archaeon]